MCLRREVPFYRFDPLSNVTVDEPYDDSRFASMSLTIHPAVCGLCALRRLLRGAKTTA